MTAPRSSTTAPGGLPELRFTRILDAPRDLVFKAWTSEVHLAQWWGPKGFTNPTCKIDLRPGGSIQIDMRAPDGVVYPMGGEFREIVKPERLVFTTTAIPDKDGKPLLETLVTVTFDEQGSQTKLSVHVQVTKAAPGAAAALSGMETGWTQTLDRLGEFTVLLRRNAWSGAEVGPTRSADGVAAKSGDREIVATRVFDAPRNLVYEAWTNPKHVANWWGPRGFTTTIQEMDVRPGGVWRLVMHGPDGTDYKNKMVFLEVVKPERLVYKHEPEGDAEPVNFQVTVTFAEEGEKTKVTFRMLFPSAAALDYVVSKHHAVEGLSHTLARLAEHLAAERGAR
jgi:uncharacterized protein YndB with AHSA1/START domain